MSTVTLLYYLRKVNEVNGEYNVFIGYCVCLYVSVHLKVCSEPVNQIVGALILMLQNAHVFPW